MSNNSQLDSLRATKLIAAYRERGHLAATLDPLGLHRSTAAPELLPAFYGFSPEDMERAINLDGEFGLQQASLNRILEILRRAYCGTLALEYTHIQNPSERQWLKDKVESAVEEIHFSNKGKRAILNAIIRAEEFEAFLAGKFPNTKRFGLEGGESLIPAVEQIIKRGQKLGLVEIVMGMAHRGRLNILANVMGKPLSSIFAEFRNQQKPRQAISGDIKYHLGASADRRFENGEAVHLSLASNPSHLEVINTVVMGKVRARQLLKNLPRHKVMGLLIHGDAAFTGQGVTMEALDLSQLRGYRIGGTIHFIINNQIGFTTSPVDARSSPYCSDLAKAIEAPVFHANGNDPEAVVRAARIAVDYRQRFGKDVVIDMFCYRRHGHDEKEHPEITQPLMYQRIKKIKQVGDIYGGELKKQRVIKKSVDASYRTKHKATLAKDFTSNRQPQPLHWLGGEWKGIKTLKHLDEPITGVPKATLRELGKKLFGLPKGFTPHDATHFKGKKWATTNAKPLSWGTAEMLAFASLLNEGYGIRLSGQDSGRGTFAQRHAKLYDQETGEKHSPLEAIKPKAVCEVIDSPLSEAGVLGYEYGFSTAAPNVLVLWEAQYGDFVNGAQVIIDQFISSAAVKWQRLSGLVLLLPHGYEGQGAEHSSARLERFLADSAQNNWQVTMCSTPANHFHLLRRQLHSKTRRVLVALTPKGLVKQAEYEAFEKDKTHPHRYCMSPFGDFCQGTFEPVLKDPEPPATTEKIAFCSGKIFFELARQRPPHTQLIRIERLYPLPEKTLRQIARAHPKAKLLWAQEEPANMGAGSWLKPKLEATLNRPVAMISRSASATPAVGFISRHNQEQLAIFDNLKTA